MNEPVRQPNLSEDPASERRWYPVTRSQPCPVCGSPDWCRIGKDGNVVICKRVPEGSVRVHESASGEIAWEHRLDTRPVPFVPIRPVAVTTVPLAPVVQRHAVYTAWLNILPLYDEHRRNLTARGFDDGWIEEACYRSVPDTPAAAARAVATLTEQFPEDPDNVLAGIPGFHRTDGKWQFGAPHGILIPVRDEEGRVVALKVRRDTTGPDQARYLWVSSQNRGGASPGAPVHIPRGFTGTRSVIRVTEGELKADLATLLTGVLTVSVPGVNSWRAAVAAARQLGAEQVLLAFDGDAATNPSVRRHTLSALQGFLDMGVDVAVEVWDHQIAKGIDDLLTRGEQPRIVTPEEFASPHGVTIRRPTRIVVSDETPDNPDVDPLAFGADDNENGRRILALFGDKMRYQTDLGRWVIWNGTRWAPDNGDTFRFASSAARLALRAAQDLPRQHGRQKLIQLLSTAPNAGRITSALKAASNAKEVRMRSTDFDTHPTLLNVANGVLDLETGTLLPHRPTLYQTGVCPVRYDPDATHPLWDRFLWDVTGGDTEMIGFLARSVGYSLQAYNPERVIFFVHGPGATGKSTFVDAVMGVLGSYATVAPFDTFLADGKSSRARDDLIDLKDARLVVSNETEPGKTFSANVVKSVSGGDRIKARRLYATEWVTYQPPYTLWLVANHTPRIDHRDDAMWDRFMWIPFTRRVPQSARNPRLKDMLCDPATCGPAILAWAVRGFIEWRNSGLRPPEQVNRAGIAQRLKEDPLGEFKQACVVADPDGWTSTKTIVTTFRVWAEHAQNPPKFGDRQLVSELAKDYQLRPVTRRQPDGSNARGWAGITVHLPEESHTEPGQETLF